MHSHLSPTKPSTEITDLGRDTANEPKVKQMKTLKRKTNNKTPYSKRTRKNKTRFKPRRGDSYYSHFRGYKKEGREMDLRETFICIQYFLIVFACVEMFATKKIKQQQQQYFNSSDDKNSNFFSPENIRAFVPKRSHLLAT